MKMTRRILSWVLAIALVVTCGITGLVLPVTAEEAPADLLNGQGTFEDDTTPASTILSDMMATADSIIVDNPSGEGKVLQIGKFVDENADGVNDGDYTHGSYLKFKKTYNAETGKYDKKLEAGKTYTITFDVYGESTGFFLAGGEMLSSNADDAAGGKSGWFQIGPDGGLTEWKTYTLVIYVPADIADTYHADWWSWGFNFAKNTGHAAKYSSVAGYTYIDNFTVVETQATGIEIDSSDIVLEPGEVTETTTVTVTPKGAAHAEIVWSSNAEGVAKVDAATGKVTAVAIGTATITATAGELTASYKVTVQKDKTRVDVDLSKFYDKPNKETAASAVEVKTDEDGTKYINVNRNLGSYSQVYVNVPLGDAPTYGFSFKARVPDGVDAETGEPVANSGNFKASLYITGCGTGYTNHYFYPRTFNSFTADQAAQSEWIQYTFYLTPTSKSSTISFGYVTDSTGLKIGFDIAEPYLFIPEEGEVNLAGEGSDFEDADLPAFLTPAAGGLGALGVSTITTDPKDPTNKVLYINSGKQWYLHPAERVTKKASDGKTTGQRFSANAMYKITFRQLIGTTQTISHTDYGQTLLTLNNPGTASSDWKTVTIYLKAGASLNSNYFVDFRTYSATYIDDFQIYKVSEATGFKINTETEMVVGESQPISYETVPKHAYPGKPVPTLTIAGDGYSISGNTLSVKPVTGVMVTSGTVTLTSSLLDENEQPITASLTINATYPEEHFVNGTMDTGSLNGIYFGSGAEAQVGVDGVGVDGSKGLVFSTTKYEYFKSQTFVMRPNSLYCFSVDYRSDGTGGKLEQIWSSGNNSSGNQLVYAIGGGSKTVKTEWQTSKMYFMTGPETTQMDGNWGFGLQPRALATKDGETAPLYVDNISLKLIATEDFIMMQDKHQDSSIQMSKDNGTTWTDTVLTDVTPGTVIKVKTWHAATSLQKPGSYKFIGNDGSVTKVLTPDVETSFTEAGFGKHTGQYFEFVMPEVNNGRLSIPTVKMSTSLNANFAMDTVATSLRYTDEQGTFDGIRFLTRVAFDKKFDPTAEEYVVTKGGVQYTILELGSLLKRYEEVDGVEVELTLDNCVWKSEAYVKGETMKLLDYTSQGTSENYTNYIDFTSVMMKGDAVAQEDFNARKYTARGYMLLDADGDGVYTEGVDLVVYSANQMTDSVNSASTRL